MKITRAFCPLCKTGNVVYYSGLDVYECKECCHILKEKDVKIQTLEYEFDNRGK